MFYIEFSPSEEISGTLLNIVILSECECVCVCPHYMVVVVTVAMLVVCVVLWKEGQVEGA